MNSVYIFKELNKPSFFQQLFNKKLPQNFVLEINNLLSQNQILEVTQADISEIANNYGSNILGNSFTGLLDLYSVYFKHCLIDKALSENELIELKHLKEILSIPNKDILELQNNYISEIYKNSFKEIISDGKIEESEQEFLNNLQKDLLLSEEFEIEISTQVRRQFVKDLFFNSLTDERLSPTEEEQLNAISKNLNVNLDINNKSKSDLDRFKFYWVIENGDIPEIDVNINLVKKEKCFFQTNCDWFELKTVTQRINYKGTTANIKIMKGVRYRIGSIKPQIVSSELLMKIDSGTLYLTNQRIIFVGELKNMNIKLQKILSFTPFSDGIEISKDSGRSPVIKFKNNIDIFSLMMSRLLNN